MRIALDYFDELNEESVCEERFTCTSVDCPKGLLWRLVCSTERKLLVYCKVCDFRF